MRKKIVVLSNSSSGLFDFRKELLVELKKETDIIVTIPEKAKKVELEGIGCKSIEIPMERRGLNPLKDFVLLKEYYKLIKKEKPAQVITYTIKPNIYGGIVCSILRVPYAANITGLGTTFQKKGILRTVVKVMYKISLAKAKVVFFENVENKNILVAENIINEKQACLLKGAGVNLDYFELSAYEQIDEVVRFLFIGRVMKEKGVDELFEATKRLYEEGDKVCLDVLGNFEENYEDKIKQFETEGWLHYYGYQKDVRPYIQKCHCFVLPSYHEGMANTNLECAAMGRPLITSRIHGCMEAVVEGKSGFLCEKQDAESLYGQMKRFVELSYEEKKAMGIAGRKHMEEVFDKRKVVEETRKRL